MLASVVGTASAVEVGTFTGTSALAVAQALAPGGRLLCCDVSETWTAIARRHWQAAGVADRIDLRIAPALETLQALPQDAAVDFAFVDADKGGYVSYYEELVPRLRAGGVLVADNVLWSGRVVDAEATDDDTEAIRAFNDHVSADDRVDRVMLAVGDGITICRKR
jgi:caffeoyl-CoA O-methyltransferase